MLDINDVEKEVKKELLKEKFDLVKDDLIKKHKELDVARKVVRNIEDEIDEIKAKAGE